MEEHTKNISNKRTGMFDSRDFFPQNYEVCLKEWNRSQTYLFVLKQRELTNILQIFC